MSYLNEKHPKLRPRVFFLNVAYTRDTFVAAGPFSPSVTSKLTTSPTFSSSNVTPFNSLEWKKRSFDSPSREMNPNPLSVIVLIVPCILISFYCYLNCYYETRLCSCASGMYNIKDAKNQ